MAEGGKASKPLDCQGSAGVVGSIKHKVGGSEKKDAGGQGVKKSVTKRVQTGPLASSRKIEHKGRAGGGQVQASPTVSDTTVKSKGDHEGRVGGAAQSLVFSEVCGDLFTCPASYSMAHCVSEDMAMGKGIAVLFKKKFGGVDQLKAQRIKPGGVAVLERDGRYIYYLVTKQRFFHKPTYKTLSASLHAMKDHCVKKEVKGVAIPKLGCGLDQLEWGRVSRLVQDIFGSVEMEILVYSL